MSAEEVANMVEDEIADYDFEQKEGEERDLSGDGGCKKLIIRQGEGWQAPEKGDEVSVHYVGTLLDGTQFDSSRDRGSPFTFKLGEGRVIKGWDTGVATMKKGELAKLTCRADYAYGAAGSPPTIPPDATLQFAVELLSWTSAKDISGDGGVIKTVVVEGQGWQTPKDGDEVLVAYTACIRPSDNASNDKARKPPQTAAQAGAPVVAASPDGGLLLAAAGDAPCRGLALALKQMKVAERALLLLSPEYAAGLAEVPEGQQLEVELTLVELHQVTTVVAGVIKKTLSCPEGSYSRPNDGSTVTVTVTTRAIEGGEVYEAERELEYVTDEEKVSEGLELAVGSMREGEAAVVTVTDVALAAPPAGALAGTGVPPGVGAVYELRLLGFKKAKEKWEMNNAEKLAAARSRKDKGNAAYKAGCLARAARQYAAALEAAASVSEHDTPGLPGTTAADGDAAAAAAGGGVSGAALVAGAREVKKAAANNWAAVELKRGNWAEAAAQATKVLDLDPANIKALFRRGSARLALGELLEAERDVAAGLLAEPGNADLTALQRRLKVALRELNKKEAKLYGRMFAALGRGSDGAAAAAAAGGDAAAAAAAAAAAPEPMQEDAPAAAAAPAAAPVVQATA